MTRPIFLAWLCLALSACATAIPSDVASTPPGVPTLHVSSDAAVDGQGISVADALRADDGPVLVNGMLLIEADGTAWLCSALAESFPPQCGGDRLQLVDLDEATALPQLTSGNGVRWSAGELQLFGTVQQGAD